MWSVPQVFCGKTEDSWSKVDKKAPTRSIIARESCDPGGRVKAKRQHWSGREETLDA